MPSYLIVGASRGLGYEWLRNLSKDPSNTIIGLVRSITNTQAKLTADTITNVHLITGDMTDTISLSNAAVEVSKITSSIDYLIINGAYIPLDTARFHPSEFTTRSAQLKEEMTNSLNVNVLGVIYSINAFLPFVRKGSVKKIIVISSGMADLDLVVQNDVPGSLIYASMKAAVNMVVAKYAVELKGEGIVVIALSPGVVNTQEGDVLPSEDEMKGIGALFQAIQAAHPEWKGPFTPAESVVEQKKVIQSVTLAQTGAFISHKGNKEWL